MSSRSLTTKVLQLEGKKAEKGVEGQNSGFLGREGRRHSLNPYLFVRAARLQNETGPEKEMIRKRIQNVSETLNPLLLLKPYLTGTSFKIAHRPKFAQQIAITITHKMITEPNFMWGSCK